MEEFNRKYDEVMLKYGFALNILETNLKNLFKEYEYKNNDSIVDHIKVRVKSKESAIKKLEQKGYEITINNLVRHVHDIIGLRIVCPFLSDVYKVVDMLKHSKFITIKDEKDYIANPKDTGYISYHLIVLVPVPLQDSTTYVEAEIQVRTMAMDFWASIDHKLQYKFPKEIPEDVKDELYKCSVDIKELDHKMTNLSEFVRNHLDN